MVELELGEEGGESPLEAIAAKLSAQEEARRLLGKPPRDEEEEPSGKRRGKRPARRAPGPASAAETLAETLAVPLILGLSAMALEEPARPTAEEAKAFAVPLLRIAFRHLPLTGKLNADIIDAVAAFAALASWYARARPYLAKVQEEEKAPAPAPAPSQNGRPASPTDIVYRFATGGAA